MAVLFLERHSLYNSPFPLSLSMLHGDRCPRLLATCLVLPIYKTPLSGLLSHILDCTYRQNTPSACRLQSGGTWISSVAGTSVQLSGILLWQAVARYSCSLPTSVAKWLNNPNVQSLGNIVYLRAIHAASPFAHLSCFIQFFLMGKAFLHVSTNRLQLFLELFRLHGVCT